MNTEQEKERDKIIESFGVHLERFAHLPPLAARIMPTLILADRKRGMTFEEIVEAVKASKSSVSTNLNLLLRLGKINYHTICGDRKRYFKPHVFRDRIKNHLQMLESQREVIKCIANYEKRYKTNPPSEKEKRSRELYKESTEQFEQTLRDLLKKIEELEK